MASRPSSPHFPTVPSPRFSTAVSPLGRWRYTGRLATGDTCTHGCRTGLTACSWSATRCAASIRFTVRASRSAPARHFACARLWRAASAPAVEGDCYGTSTGSLGSPWAVAIGQDLQMPSSSGRQSRAQAVVSAWASQVARRAVHGDLRAQQVLMRTYHLESSATALLHPALLASVALGQLHRTEAPEPRPALLDDLAA